MDFENIGNLYNGIKELGKIYNKMSTIEMQKIILELSEQALEMQNEILKLREENIKLNKKEEIESKIERHKDAYITLKGSEQIYCAVCWDAKGILVQGQTNNDGSYYCSICKEMKYYDKELHDRMYSDNNYDSSEYI